MWFVCEHLWHTTCLVRLALVEFWRELNRVSFLKPNYRTVDKIIPMKEIISTVFSQNKAIGLITIVVCAYISNIAIHVTHILSHLDLSGTGLLRHTISVVYSRNQSL